MLLEDLQVLPELPALLRELSHLRFTQAEHLVRKHLCKGCHLQTNDVNPLIDFCSLDDVGAVEAALVLGPELRYAQHLSYVGLPVFELKDWESKATHWGLGLQLLYHKLVFFVCLVKFYC